MTLLVLIALIFAAIQGQQLLLRWRAERLLADASQIRLYQSSWADAQVLMRRWGAWGNYDGTCSAKDCRYQITLGDLTYRYSKWMEWFALHHGFDIYSFFGGRSARVAVSFTVHDGTIWRKEAGVLVSDNRIGHWYGSHAFPLTLIVQTKSRQRLRKSEQDWWIMGADEQLAFHPYYKAGRPGGCKINCEEAVVTYSTHTPTAEIERLSSFNLSCLTKFKPCTDLAELLPAAREWRLYSPDDLQSLDKTANAPCALPLWAVARDSRYVLAVNVVSSTSQKQPGTFLNPSSGVFEKTGDFTVEEAQVKIEDVLKGAPPWPRSSIVTANPFAGRMDELSPYQVGSEHLLPGRAYLVFPTGDDRRDQKLTTRSAMDLARCAVWDDTPENRLALQTGFAQNDNLADSERR